jgi:hypothetical protein
VISCIGDGSSVVASGAGEDSVTSMLFAGED